MPWSIPETLKPRRRRLLAPVLALLLTAAVSAPAQDAFWGFEGARKDHLETVWEARLESFRDAAYGEAVERLFASFEERTGRSLSPGAHRRVGLKVYANSGNGLGTPMGLTRAVIAALERRGYDREELFIFDLRRDQLRRVGYLPPLSRRAQVGSSFAGVPVRALEDEDMRDEVWFYENPLPTVDQFPLPEEIAASLAGEKSAEDRKSYLPAPILTDVDFWINLPVGIDHPAFGMSGALANATVWNMTNRKRFLVSPANAPIAMAEVAAIPELVANWAFTMVSLETYQFIGGPMFNALYTDQQPRVWMSVNPVAIDALLVREIDAQRKRYGFKPLPFPLPILDFAESLGLGPQSPDVFTWIRP